MPQGQRRRRKPRLASARLLETVIRPDYHRIVLVLARTAFVAVCSVRG
jgi:hypothetical protein